MFKLFAKCDICSKFGIRKETIFRMQSIAKNYSSSTCEIFVFYKLFACELRKH